MLATNDPTADEAVLPRKCAAATHNAGVPRTPDTVAEAAAEVEARGGSAAMVTRLSASDASFYHLEDTSTPMYVGSLSILRRPKAGPFVRDAAAHRRAAAAADSALPAEGARGDPRAGPAGVDRRPRLRHHLSRPALGAAVAGQRRPAARADRAAGVATAGPVAAAVGDVPGRRARQEPPRDLHEVPPGAGQRHDGAGDRTRDRRPDAAPARVRRGHLDPGARTVELRAGDRRRRGLGGAAHHAAGGDPRPRSTTSSPTPATSPTWAAS